MKYKNVTLSFEATPQRNLKIKDEIKMATKKTTKKAEEAKTAVKETVKETEKKVAAKAETKKAEQKAPAAKKEVKKAEKKAPAKKPAKKAAPKALIASTVKGLFFEYGDKQVDAAALAELAKAAYKENGGTAAIRSIELYVKAEDNALYYVINGKENGKVEL